MKILRLLKIYAGLVALSLIFFVLFGSSLLDLAKALALSTAVLLFYAFFYPYVRGVKRGDTVLILTTQPGLFSARFGKAASDAKLGEEIRVFLPNGRELIGVVISYEGLFSPAKVRMLFEKMEHKEVIR